MLGSKPIGLTALLLVVSGCAGSLPEAHAVGMKERAKIGASPMPSEYCSGLDSAHRTWGGIGKVSALLAGGSGVATIPTDDKDVRTGLAIGAAAAAAIAAGSIYFSEDAASSWARDCQ